MSLLLLIKVEKKVTDEKFLEYYVFSVTKSISHVTQKKRMKKKNKKKRRKRKGQIEKKKNMKKVMKK